MGWLIRTRINFLALVERPNRPGLNLGVGPNLEEGLPLRVLPDKPNLCCFRWLVGEGGKLYLHTGSPVVATVEQ